MNSPPSRIGAPAADLTPASEATIFFVFALGYVLVFTCYAVLAKNNLTLSVNMVENWIWGKEFQLGYFKHPPLFAWVTGAWFLVFPRTDGAYYLLASSIVAIGFAGTWAAIGTIDTGHRRTAAIGVLAFSPLYSFLSLKFNANTILIAVWPWAIWAFLKALERPSAGNGARLGALLALGMLGKYFTATLILTMLVVVLTEPDRRRLLRSPAMIAAVATGLAVLSPHLVWMVETDFQTLTYAGHVRNEGTARTLLSLATFPIAHLLYQLPIVVAVLACVDRSRWPAFGGLFAGAWSEPDRRRMLLLAFGPFVATMTLGILAFSGLPALWGEPLWLLTGWSLLAVPGLESAAIDRRRLVLLLAVAGAGLLMLAPLVNEISILAGSEEATLPIAEIADEAAGFWHETAGTAPFAIVTGDELLAGSISFYAAEAPSELQGFDFRHSPWIDPARLRRQGALAVCRDADEACITAARATLGPDTAETSIIAAKTRHGTMLPPMTVRLLVLSPSEPVS